MKIDLIKGDARVIGEPTGLTNITIAEKGALWLELTIYGRASHGSRSSNGVKNLRSCDNEVLEVLQLAITRDLLIRTPP